LKQAAAVAAAVAAAAEQLFMQLVELVVSHAEAGFCEYAIITKNR
jgi:hypothetical protein